MRMPSVETSSTGDRDWNLVVEKIRSELFLQVPILLAIGGSRSTHGHYANMSLRRKSVAIVWDINERIPRSDAL
jgi:hypothetical protein